MNSQFRDDCNSLTLGRGSLNWWFLFVYYCLAVIWGIRRSYWWEPSFLDLMFNPVMCYAIGCWVINDSMLRSQRIPLLSRSWMVCAGSIGAMCYCVMWYGWKGVAIALFHSVIWFLVCYIVTEIAQNFV